MWGYQPEMRSPPKGRFSVGDVAPANLLTFDKLSTAICRNLEDPIKSLAETVIMTKQMGVWVDMYPNALPDDCAYYIVVEDNNM